MTSDVRDMTTGDRISQFDMLEAVLYGMTTNNDVYKSHMSEKAEHQQGFHNAAWRFRFLVTAIKVQFVKLMASHYHSASPLLHTSTLCFKRSSSKNI